MKFESHLNFNYSRDNSLVTGIGAVTKRGGAEGGEGSLAVGIFREGRQSRRKSVRNR